MGAESIKPSPAESPQHFASRRWNGGTLPDDIGRTMMNVVEAIVGAPAPPSYHTRPTETLTVLEPHLLGGLCALAVRLSYVR